MSRLFIIKILFVSVALKDVDKTDVHDTNNYCNLRRIFFIFVVKWNVLQRRKAAEKRETDEIRIYTTKKKQR